MNRVTGKTSMTGMTGMYGGPEGSHKFKMLLQIKNSTCKLKIVHAN